VSCRGIRFEVSKEHWCTDPLAYADLPAKVVGVIEQWRNKREGKIYVEWESDASNSDEHLSVLLQASLDFKLLPFEDGRTAPKAKGMAAKRAYAEAVAQGRYAETAERA
jgi:hypothetical protein